VNAAKRSVRPDTRIEVFGTCRVELKHLNKCFFPGAGLTKGDVIAYYKRVAKVMLPHLADRALTLQRFPDGITGEGFFQKHLPAHFPDWFARTDVVSDAGGMTVPVCNNLASLVYVANQGAICLHTGLSRLDEPDAPDLMVFDLDPPHDGFEPVRRAAADCLALLDKLGLPGFLKTTGSQGMHVAVPLRREATFDEVRDFARDCARWLVHRDPDRYTLEQRIDARGRRLYLDVTRNAYGQTVVAPYSLRALPGAPIALPIVRDRLTDPALHARHYLLSDITRQLAAADDPWYAMRRRAHGIGKPQCRLARLWQRTRGKVAQSN